ncbi:MAG: ABC transporter substrate-binding protein, partial [Clostridiales bacterium]|nr:ABC transporter substrate-binding protein [Clostridiales bacterium]
MKRFFALAFTAVFLFGCTPRVPYAEGESGGEPVPAYGGAMKIYSYNPDTLNPIYTRNRTNAQMLMLIFDFLITCGGDQRPIPALASEYSVSADGLTWTVRLRDGVTWHDGSAFTAADVAATLTAVKNSTHGSPYRENLSNAVKIEAAGSAVIITLAAPQTNFINLLEIPMVKASEANVLDGFRLVGTGQFVYAESTNKLILLSANKGWWGESTPYIDNVEVALLPDKSTAVYA